MTFQSYLRLHMHMLMPIVPCQPCFVSFPKEHDCRLFHLCLPSQLSVAIYVFTRYYIYSLEAAAKSGCDLEETQRGRG